MSRAVATAPPLPMGFRFDTELSLTGNARAAWEARKTVHLAQIERNARTLLRRIFPKLDSEKIEFKYYEGIYPDVPTFVIDDELFAFNHERKQMALVEICISCQKQWQWDHFDSLASLGRELASRDAREPFTCRACEAFAGAKK